MSKAETATDSSTDDSSTEEEQYDLDVKSDGVRLIKDGYSSFCLTVTDIGLSVEFGEVSVYEGEMRLKGTSGTNAKIDTEQAEQLPDAVHAALVALSVA